MRLTLRLKLRLIRSLLPKFLCFYMLYLNSFRETLMEASIRAIRRFISSYLTICCRYFFCKYFLIHFLVRINDFVCFLLRNANQSLLIDHMLITIGKTYSKFKQVKLISFRNWILIHVMDSSCP